MRRTSLILLSAGIALWIGSVAAYGILGYRAWVGLLWASSIVCIALGFFRRGEKTPHQKYLTKADGVTVILILLAFAPLYLAQIDTVPWQVNTDEVTISTFAKKIAGAENPDPFGIARDYFGFPNLPFLVFGKIARALGGVSLAHMRTVHAASGLFIVAAAYFFFRELFTRGPAAIATIVLGANHSLVAISRMAMRDNTGLFIELLALTLLLTGLRRKSLMITFLGGIAAGLAFYTYYPSRITLVVWFFFFGALILVKREKFLWKLIPYTLIGFLFAVGPLAVATIQAGGSALSYPREQFLFLPEGRALQVEWSGGLPVGKAIKENIVKGLSTFNAPIHDHGYIYPNYGHGFVDPMTGILLWVGVVVAILRLASREGDRRGELLALIGFITLYLAFSFAITKAPNYTRLLVALPFVAYLSSLALRRAGEFAAAALHAPRGKKMVRDAAITAGTLAIIVLNFGAFGDFVTKGIAEGNDIGGTGRYVETRRGIPGYSFYLAAGSDYPYYRWGMESQWRDWLGFFAEPSERVKVIAPAGAVDSPKKIPFTLFMNRRLFEKEEVRLRSRYPSLSLHRIKPDGSLLAIEVLAP